MVFGFFGMHATVFTIIVSLSVNKPLMKQIIVTVLSVFSSMMVLAQSYEGTIEYQKKDQKAMVIDFPYSPSVVEDAIVMKMEKMGHKKKESKGFLVYKNVVISEISSEPADYMIKVERKSRKEKDESVVYVVMNRAEENLIARSDAMINSNVKTFLNEMTPHVEAHNLEVEIKKQEEAVAKAEKKLKNLVADKESMEKKIKNLQDDLKENAKDQESQAKEIETQKQALEAMVGKRKA
jgi:hypothetical protein